MQSLEIIERELQRLGALCAQSGPLVTGLVDALQRLVDAIDNCELADTIDSTTTCSACGTGMVTNARGVLAVMNTDYKPTDEVKERCHNGCHS
jgi:recombinational DNA repair protein RecR